jgi:hypothetical protein
MELQACTDQALVALASTLLPAIILLCGLGLFVSLDFLLGRALFHLLGFRVPSGHRRAAGVGAVLLHPSSPQIRRGEEGEDKDKDELMYFHALASTGREAALGWVDPSCKQALRYCSKWNWSQEAWSLRKSL